MAIQSSPAYAYALQAASMLWRCLITAAFTAGMACTAHADDGKAPCSGSADTQLSDAANGRSLRAVRLALHPDEDKSEKAPSQACKIYLLRRAFKANDYDTAALLFNENPPLEAGTQKELILTATGLGDPALLELALAHSKPGQAVFDNADPIGETPLAVASHRGNTIILNMLLKANNSQYTERDGQFSYAVKQAACMQRHNALDLLLGYKGNTPDYDARNAALSASLASQKDPQDKHPEIALAEKYCSAADEKAVADNKPVDSGCASTNNTHRKGKTQYSDCRQAPPLLESNNPNLLGYSRERGEQNYLDIGLSLRYPLAFDKLRDSKVSNWFPYFAFDMRGAFYINDRPSSPVIIRAFNPSLHVRRFASDQKAETARDDPFAEYWDGAYGHLSNGQTIDTWASLEAQADAIKNGNKADLSCAQALAYARDYISRGWDYAELNYHNALWKQAPDDSDGSQIAYTLGIRRYFGGFLQKEVEEFNLQVDTPRAITMLNQVNGLSLGIYDQLSKSVADVSHLHDFSLSLSTGLLDAGKWNSAKFSVTTRPVKYLDVPLTLWISNGYVNTLSQYYLRQTAMGFAFSFDTE